MRLDKSLKPCRPLRDHKSALRKSLKPCRACQSRAPRVHTDPSTAGTFAHTSSPRWSMASIAAFAAVAAARGGRRAGTPSWPAASAARPCSAPSLWAVSSSAAPPQNRPRHRTSAPPRCRLGCALACSGTCRRIPFTPAERSSTSRPTECTCDRRVQTRRSQSTLPARTRVIPDSLHQKMRRKWATRAFSGRAPTKTSSAAARP